MNKPLIKNILVFSLFAAFFVFAFYWNEARKELVFLCENFNQGIPEQSVRNQLDTGNLLQYHTENLPTGKRIIAESPFNLWIYQCVVDLDSKDLVKESWIE